MAKKRANGEGSIRRKSNGRWEGQLMVGYKSDGRRDIRSVSGATQREVRKKLDEYIRQQNMGVLPRVDLYFGEWADSWLEGRRDRISATSFESYRYTLRILKEHFGQWKLSDIKVIHVEQFLRKIRESGKSDSYVSKCRAMLYQILNKAAACDLIMKNPVAYAEKMRKTPPKRKEAFTLEEVQQLMECLPDDRIGWSIRLLLTTGMRTQELLALKPQNISEDGAWIAVEQAVVRVKGGIAIGPTKSFAGTRTIPVPECTRYCARNLRNTDNKYIWEAGKPGMPCNPSHFARQFRKAIQSVPGVRELTPHSTRHTYISILQMLDVDLETIRPIVGHAEIDMTRYYLHVQEPKRLEAVQRLSTALSGNREQNPID